MVKKCLTVGFLVVFLIGLSPVVSCAGKLPKGHKLEIDDKTLQAIKTFLDDIYPKHEKLIVTQEGRNIYLGDETKSTQVSDEVLFVKFDEAYDCKLKELLVAERDPEMFFEIIDEFFAKKNRKMFVVKYQGFVIEKEAQLKILNEIFEKKFHEFWKKISSTFFPKNPNFFFKPVEKLFKQYLKWTVDDVYDMGLIADLDWCNCDIDQLCALGWCTCKRSRPEKRFYLMLDFLNEVAKKPKEMISYVSFGAGTLLQEYLTVFALINLGFKKIDLYLIDVGYGDKEEGIDIEGFKDFFYSKFGDDAKRALESVERIFKKYNIKTKAYNTALVFLKGYSSKKDEADDTESDFLKEDSKKDIDVLFLIDPVSFKGEMISTEAKHTNHLGVECKFKLKMQYADGSVDKVVVLLPFKGKPQIFVKGDIPKEVKNLLLDEAAEYKGYENREAFVRNVKGDESVIYKAYQIFKSGSSNINIAFKQSQSQRYSFYEIILLVASKDTIIYQMDDDIFIGAINLRAREYISKGYEELKEVPLP